MSSSSAKMAEIETDQKQLESPRTVCYFSLSNSALLSSGALHLGYTRILSRFTMWTHFSGGGQFP